MSDEIKTVFVDHGPPQEISLRDYFAGQALKFCLSEYGDTKLEIVYQIADSLLLEREKGGNK